MTDLGDIYRAILDKCQESDAIVVAVRLSKEEWKMVLDALEVAGEM